MTAVRYVLLIVALLVIVGGLGFYFGRVTSPAAQTPAASPSSPQSRTRTVEPAAPPPNPATPGSSTPPTLDPLQPLTDEPRIGLPITNLSAKNVQDTFNQERPGERKHEATDILAPRGTPVLAIDNGIIKKLFLSKPGGNTVYQFDPTERYCYYYAHLDHYADDISEGKLVHTGDIIGYVGTSGNADPNTPHLHLAIFQLGPEKQWWKGMPVNPYPLLMKAVSARAQ